MMRFLILSLGLLLGTTSSAPTKLSLVEKSKNYDYVASRPVVTVIKDGVFSMNADGSMGMSSSVVYVYDGPDCEIIVDTGVPSDTRTILRALAVNEILPTDITLVISTHLQPDHVGNLNLFSYATFVSSNMTAKNQIFTPLPPTDVDGLSFLCPNVAVARVKGHTTDDNIVLVYNATNYGNVTVTGDNFMSRDDIADESIWRKFSACPGEQQQLRRMVIADSDYIIPGHGQGFKVTKDMRQAVGSAGVVDPKTLTCTNQKAKAADH